MQTSTIRLCDVEDSDVARPLTGGSVDALAASMDNIGLIQPITVRTMASRTRNESAGMRRPGSC